MQSMMTPLLILVCWTLVVWVWLYLTRVPAMKKAKIHPQKAVHPGALSALPEEVRAVADNYNHLHEQPVIFYALVVYSHLIGVADPLNIALAWGYVGLRVAHTLVQIVLRRVMVRFYLFALSSILLVVIALRNVFALIA